MKKIFKSLISITATLTLLLCIFPVSSQAATNTTVTLNKTNLNIGDTVKATVKVNIKNMYSVNLSLRYDKNSFEYVSGASRAGSGTAKIVESLSGESTISYTVTFKAIKAGTAAFSVIGSVGAQASAGAMATDVSVSCKSVNAKIHSYETTTVKATLTKNGKTEKKCSVCGYVASSSTIKKIDTVKLSYSSYTYNGNVRKPSVTVTDSAGKTVSSKYYTVDYASGRKNVGKYKVTVKFKGNYSGTKTLYFKINPVKTTVSKLTPGKKSIKVYVTKKTSQVTGYQIYCSTSKTFESCTKKYITNYKTTSTTLSGLSTKKTYYVKVRTYKTVDGIKYYSGWSTYKYTKTK